MPETTETPVEQAPGSPQPGAGDNWKARYDGLVLKVQQLTLDGRNKDAQLTTLTSENEQLKAQLGLKDTEKQVAIAAREQKVQEILTAKSQADTELSELRAFKLKVKVANDMGRPELVGIINSIPNLTDETALKTVFSDFTNFADKAVQKREKELMAGVTPPLGGGGNQAPALPATEGAWDKHVNSLALRSPERQKAMDQYWDWLQANHS